MSRPAVSSGPVARFEDDHGSLGRPPPGVGVELRIDRDPALPQPITLLPRGLARAHRVRMLAGQSNDGVGMGFEVEPPRGMALVPAVHRNRDEVRAVNWWSGLLQRLECPCWGLTCSGTVDPSGARCMVRGRWVLAVLVCQAGSRL